MATKNKTPEQFLIDKVGHPALAGLKWKSLADRKKLLIEAMEEYKNQEIASILNVLKKCKRCLEENYPLCGTEIYDDSEIKLIDEVRLVTEELEK